MFVVDDAVSVTEFLSNQNIKEAYSRCSFCKFPRVDDRKTANLSVR